MKRLYVLTRNDLGTVYQSVQGSHAVAQFMLDHPDNEWKNGYLIFLGVENEESLKLWFDKITNKNTWYEMKDKYHKIIPISYFEEPDLDNQLTALAVYTTGRIFKDLPLVTQSCECESSTEAES